MVLSQRKFLIGGMDAGLHTSFALLDLDGNLVSLSTMHSPRTSETLVRMTETGRVVALATDRTRSPGSVKKIASSIAAKLILPSRNMTRKKKRILIKEHFNGEAEDMSLNSHEKASLASAIFAYRRFRPGFKKLFERLEKEGEEERYEELKKKHIISRLEEEGRLKGIH